MPSVETLKEPALLAPSLFLLLIIAKFLSLPVAVLGIVPLIAWFWQDVFIAALFALLERCTRNKFFLRASYVLVIAYIALNLAIVQVLSTPLTWTMLQATDSAIGDSIAMYISWKVLGPSLLFILLTPLVYFWTREMRFPAGPRPSVRHPHGLLFSL